MEKGFKVTTFSIPASAFDPVVDVKQLRLGNWLQSFIIMDDGTGHISKRCVMPFQADLKTMEILSDSQGRHFATMEPISLSPELLEKAGFTYEGERDGQPTYTKWEDVSCFRITKGAGIRNYYYIPCYPTVQVRNLHQLQNLYFALMEQELEISL